MAVVGIAGLSPLAAIPAHAGADTVGIVGGRFPAGQAAVGVDIRIVNGEGLWELSVPLEFREVTSGAFVLSLGPVNFLNRLSDPAILPENRRTEQFETPSGVACVYGAPSFSDGMEHSVAASPEGFWVYMSGNEPADALDPGADAPGTGSIRIGFATAPIPGTFEVDTMCVDPGLAGNHLRFVNAFGVDLPVVFKKGTVRLNGPPIARDTTFTVKVNEFLDEFLPASDPNVEDTLVFGLVAPPPPPGLDLDPSGRFVYSAPPTEGIVTFDYMVDDGLLIDEGTVTIVVEPLPPDTVYVRKNGSDTTGDGSAGNPLRTIPFALSVVNSGSLIMVGPGTYNEPGEVPIVFPLSKTMTIRSEAGPFVTELVGTPDASGSVVVMDLGNDVDTVTIDGFTIRDNSVSAGCTYCAGGISVVNLTVARILNCIIRDNASNETAGGLLLAGSSSIVANNWIVGNLGTTPLAVGGIQAWGSANAAIVNNTIVANSGPSASGVAGIHIEDQSAITQVDNNIIAFNSPGYGAFASGSLGSSQTLNNVYFGNGGSPQNFPSLLTWILSDPMLRDAAAGNLHLTCGSPARNAAEFESVPNGLNVDIDGQPRVSSNPPPLHVDIGADQFYDEAKEAAFVQTVDIGCAPLPVDFINVSTCIDEAWIWSFGDGGTSTDKNPSHEYLTAGTYEVRLIASGAYDADTTYDTVHVDGEIDVTFISDVQSGCVPFPVTFTAFADPDADLFVWDFGDGGVDTGQQVTHTYATVATRTVSVSASNTCSTSTHTVDDYIQAETLPDVQIISSFDTVAGAPCSPYGVQFHYTSNYPILDWSWDFGDNGTSTDSMPFHTYASGDTFSVRLIATGECGVVQDINQNYIRLTPRPMVSGASATPDFACVGITDVAFGATITGNFSSAIWIFGDGTTGAGATTTHTFGQVGRYRPKLVVVSNCGQDTVPIADSITVGSLPTALFSVDADSGYEPLEVQFTDESSNLPGGWEWRFGNGATSSLQNPSFDYTSGIYQASLIAANPCGTDTSADRRIVVGTFQIAMDSLGTAGDTIFYNVGVDSDFIAYDHTVYLSGRITPLPVQGSMNFVFSPAAGVPPFVSALKAVPSLNLVSGSYTIEVRAIDSTRLNLQGQPVTRTATEPYIHVGFTALEVVPSPVNMDSTIVTQGLTSRNVTIRNTSTPAQPFTLIVQPAQTSGPPFEIVQGQGASLSPGGTLAWTIGFRPTKKGDFSGILHVRSNDPGNSDLQVTIRGRGIGEQVPPGVASSSPGQNAEALINTNLALTFDDDERMVIVPQLDTIVEVRSKRAGATVAGLSQMTAFGLTFTPTEWFWPDDTVTMTVRATLTDTNGNRLDGNGDGIENGPPTDDYRLTFFTGPGVFPGDANHDGIVNEADILPLGRFWRLQGPPRANPYTSFSVQPARGFPTRIAAHADCDGNGVIDSADICPIAEFFERDTVLPKAIVQKWLTEAQSWSSSTVDALLGALIDCPTQTQGNTILRDVLRAMQAANPLPKDYALEQNYPNPFNPATIIAFSLPQASDVRLEVFDILGQRITTLASGRHEAGYHRLVWDGRDENGREMASGIYFYRLQADQLRQTRKMLLLK